MCNCRCSVCPCTHSTQYAGMQSGEVTNTSSVLSSFSTVFPADAQVKKNWPGQKLCPAGSFQTNDLNGEDFREEKEKMGLRYY